VFILPVSQGSIIMFRVKSPITESDLTGTKGKSGHVKLRNKNAIRETPRPISSTKIRKKTGILLGRRENPNGEDHCSSKLHYYLIFMGRRLQERGRFTWWDKGDVKRTTNGRQHQSRTMHKKRQAEHDPECP